MRKISVLRGGKLQLDIIKPALTVLIIITQKRLQDYFSQLILGINTLLNIYISLSLVNRILKSVKLASKQYLLLMSMTRYVYHFNKKRYTYYKDKIESYIQRDCYTQHYYQTIYSHIGQCSQKCVWKESTQVCKFQMSLQI